MKQLLVLVLAGIACLSATAQADSLVQFTIQSKKVKDHVYEVSAKAEIKEGWHLYGINKAVEGLDPLQFSFTDEAVQLEGSIRFDHAPVQIKDPIFSTNTHVYTGTVVASQQFTIRGAVPAKLKGVLHANLGREGEFIQKDQAF